MFNLKIVDTDEFLDMPPTTQNLYFHLCMRADDDGFVSNPKKIIKIANAASDDIKVLIGKRFVIPFNSGICVIKHWKIHNLIQKDRYIETEYKQEKELLIEKDKKYELNGIQNVSILDTQVRLGKIRLDKVSKDMSANADNSLSSPLKKTAHEGITELFDFYNAEFKKFSGKMPIFNWGQCEKLAKPYIESLGLEKMKFLLKCYLYKGDKNERQFFKENVWSLSCFLAVSTINKLNLKYDS